MEHKHDYDTVFRHSVTQEVANLGIKAAEVRKCKTCGHEMTFVFIKEEWVPLFEDVDREAQDILLA
jgi:hypothetical protein